LIQSTTAIVVAGQGVGSRDQVLGQVVEARQLADDDLVA
jgi:hypothetical protein